MDSLDLSVLLQYGALGVFMLYTLVRDWRRDSAYSERYDTLDSFVRTELIVALRGNTRVQDQIVDALRQRPCLLNIKLEEEGKGV